MKKTILFALCAVMALVANAQNVMVVEKNDNTTMKLYIDDIKRVYFAQDDEPGGEPVNLPEDVYTIGKTDYSSAWWADFSKSYQIPDGEVWKAQFDLHINPNTSSTYKNFAIIITNDEDRGSSDYKEYGAMRFDHQPSGNSEWGTYIDRSYVSSTLTFDTDNDPGVQQLGGRVKLTIDRSNPNAFVVTITNGKVTKTYSQPYAMTNLNTDQTNKNIRVFLVPEGCYIDFLGSNIEPIGGYTSSADKQPLTLTLSKVPAKVLLGTSLEDAFANIEGIVQFQENVSRTISMADMQLSVSPDMSTPGDKTLTATYGKTFYGDTSDQPVSATISFKVIEESYTTIGATDNTTAFLGASSEAIKVASGETFISTFTNYTSGSLVWNNFVVVLHAADNSEYAVLRTDNYGWGSGYDADIETSGGQDNWNTWLAAMDGAKVTVFVTNNGNGTANVRFTMHGTDGIDYFQYYNGVKINSDDFYFHLTVDNSHIVFDDHVGAIDDSSTFWSEHSDMWNVEEGKTVTRRFKNFGGVESNWNNFNVVLSKADNTEYAVLRADNYGWGSSYTSCTPIASTTDWEEWKAAMSEATCTVSVTNNGTTVDVKCIMQGKNGATYTQDYIGLSPVEANDVFFRFTIDKCHLVFE